MPSSCNINLLLTASLYVYKGYADYYLLDGQSTWNGYSIIRQAPKESEEYFATKKLEQQLADHQYKVYAAKSSTGIGSVHESQIPISPTDYTPGLGYGVFTPVDVENSKDPIVIAYRGTKISQDICEDIKIGLTGVAGQKYQEDAYAVYLAVRQQWPHRTIVLTGHSLGGHLANYVAQRASAENEDEQLIHVRTFNSAGISSAFAQNMVSSQKEIKQPNVFHYSLWGDPLRHMANPGQKIVCFAQPRQPLAAHRLKNLIIDLPEQIKQLPVGTSIIHTLKEAILGMKLTYEFCRTEVNNQQYGTQEPFLALDGFQANLLAILDNEHLDEKAKLQQAYDCLKIYKEALDNFQQIFAGLSQEIGLLMKRCQQYQTPLIRDIKLDEEENALRNTLQVLITQNLQDLVATGELTEIIPFFNTVQKNLLRDLGKVLEQTKYSTTTKDYNRHFILANQIVANLYQTELNTLQFTELTKLNGKLQEFFALFLNQDPDGKLKNSINVEQARIYSILNGNKTLLIKMSNHEKVPQQFKQALLTLTAGSQKDYTAIKNAANSLIYVLKINSALANDFPDLAEEMLKVVKSIQRIENLQHKVPQQVQKSHSQSASLAKIGLYAQQAIEKEGKTEVLASVAKMQ